MDRTTGTSTDRRWISLLSLHIRVADETSGTSTISSLSADTEESRSA